MKRVSVILTTYNSEKILQRTLDSIFSQEGSGSQFELELIAVDDSSTDATLEILKKNDITYLSTLHNTGGPNTGRNLGIRASSGDYICIADHDDVWMPHRLISILPHLEYVPIVTSGYTQIDIKTKKEVDRISKHPGPFIYYEQNKTFLNKLKRGLNGQNTYLGSIIYDSRLKHILFEENFGCVDFDWVLRLFHHNASIELCESLYYRYVNDGNLSLNEGYRIKDFYYSLMFIEEYGELYPSEYHQSFAKSFGSQARYYYQMKNMKKARFYLLRSGFSLKSLAYFFTSYFGSEYVRRNYNVFG